AKAIQLLVPFGPLCSTEGRSLGSDLGRVAPPPRSCSPRLHTAVALPNAPPAMVLFLVRNWTSPSSLAPTESLPSRVAAIPVPIRARTSPNTATIIAGLGFLPSLFTLLPPPLRCVSSPSDPMRSRALATTSAQHYQRVSVRGWV